MKNLTRSFFIALMALSFVVGLACDGKVQAAAKMPAFTLENVVDGTKVSSSSYEGQVLLISFFATWCPPCIEEIPTFNYLQKKYKKKGFSVIALSVDQGGTSVVTKFVEKRKIQYPVLMADSETMKNFGGVYGVPVSFLVNRDGKVVKKYPGYVPKSILTKDIESVMK